MKFAFIVWCLFTAPAFAQLSDSLSKTQVTYLKGTYSKCIIQTKVAGVERSSQIEYAFNEDQSMYLEVRMYSGSSQCLGVGDVSDRVEGFRIDSVFSVPQLTLIEVTHLESGDAYNFIFKEKKVTVTISSNSGETDSISRLEKK